MWLEGLGYGQKVAGMSLVQGWALPYYYHKILSVISAVNGYFFKLKRIRQQREIDGLCLSFAVPKIQ